MTEPHANKQLEILRFIYDTVEERAFPPTVREICSAVDLSSTFCYYLYQNIFEIESEASFC